MLVGMKMLSLRCSAIVHNVQVDLIYPFYMCNRADKQEYEFMTSCILWL